MCRAHPSPASALLDVLPCQQPPNKEVTECDVRKVSAGGFYWKDRQPAFSTYAICSALIVFLDVPLQVHALVEGCLQRYFNLKQTCDTLQQLGVDSRFTALGEWHRCTLCTHAIFCVPQNPMKTFYLCSLASP